MSDDFIQSNKFKQADSTEQRRQGGTGLGLNISKAIVELWGGIISVRPQLGPRPLPLCAAGDHCVRACVGIGSVLSFTWMAPRVPQLQTLAGTLTPDQEASLGASFIACCTGCQVMGSDCG